MQTPACPTRQPQFMIEMKRRQLDQMPWAIVKVNRQGIFTYGNDVLHRLLGIDRIEGRALADLFQADNLTLVLRELESRFTCRASSQYRVEATRPGDGVRLAIQCSAIPEIDESSDVIGSIAILRRLSDEDITTQVAGDVIV